jgi:uncharacterized protein YkuJ
MNLKEFFEIVGEDCPLIHEASKKLYFKPKDSYNLRNPQDGGNFIFDDYDPVKIENGKAVIGKNFAFLVGLRPEHEIFHMKDESWKDKIIPGVTISYTNWLGDVSIFKLSQMNYAGKYHFINLTKFNARVVGYESWEDLKQLVVKNVLSNSKNIKIFNHETFAKILNEELCGKRYPDFSS